MCRWRQCNRTNRMIKEKNMNEMTINAIFPIPVTKININRKFTKEELQLCLTDLPMYIEKEAGMFNHRSKETYLFENFPNLKDIENLCKHQLKNYLEKIEGVDTNLANLRITQSWLNNTKPGESHHSHVHPNSYLSGVLYIKCLPNDRLLFRNRSYGMYNNFEFPKNDTVWNARIVGQTVTEGDLIIFPSWIPHSVSRNETKN